MFKTPNKMLFGLNRKVALTVPNNDDKLPVFIKIWQLTLNFKVFLFDCTQ